MIGILCSGFLFLGCCILLTAVSSSTLSVLLALVALVCALLMLTELVRYYKANPLVHLAAAPKQAQPTQSASAAGNAAEAASEVVPEAAPVDEPIPESDEKELPV